jgi:hypothetical protein
MRAGVLLNVLDCMEAATPVIGWADGNPTNAIQ